MTARRSAAEIAAEIRREPLTDRTVQAIRAAPGALLTRPDGFVKGLELRVSSTTKSWSLRYRVRQRLRRWTMGDYPTVSLAAAREQARDELAKMRAARVRGDFDYDPATATLDARTAPTLAQLAETYLAHVGDGGTGRPPRKRSWKQDRRIIRAIILPAWKHRAVASIGRRDVKALLARVASGRHRSTDDPHPAPVMANRTQALLSALFTFAMVEEEWIDANPVSKLALLDETARERVLSDDEIRTLWAVLEAQQTAPTPVLNPMIALGLQVLLLTAQRPGEVFTMRWSDLDLNEARGHWWTIPTIVAKNARAHRVPLTPRVVALIEAARTLMTTAAAVAAARGRPFPANPFVFATTGHGTNRRGGGRLGGNVAKRATLAMEKLVTTQTLPFDVHRHDLRRTASTNMGALGVPRDHISYVLNHVGGGSTVTKIYDRYDHDAEKRVALEAWARRLETILTAGDETRAPLVFVRV